jgi:hypothetical protein
MLCRKQHKYERLRLQQHTHPAFWPNGERATQSLQCVTHVGSLLALQPITVAAQSKPWGSIATRLLWPWLLTALAEEPATSTPYTLSEAKPARWRSAQVSTCKGPAQDCRA